MFIICNTLKRILIEGQSGQLKQVGGSDGVVGGISVIIQFMWVLWVHFTNMY